jgi:hypothetical protein
MDSWRITGASEPVEDPARWSELEDELVDALQAMPGATGVVGWGRVGEMGAVFCVQAPDLAGAAAAGARTFTEALVKLEADVKAVRLEVEPFEESERWPSPVS